MDTDLVPLLDDDGGTDGQSTSRRKYTVISEHESAATALAAMQHIDGLRYRYLYNQGSRSATAIYECAIHPGCPKRIRLVTKWDENNQNIVVLEQDDCEHADEKESVDSRFSSRKKRGISPILKAEVDAMLSGGAGPKKCRLLLMQKYKKKSRMVALIPDELQLKNRKASLKKEKNGGWYIKNAAQLLNWASERMCETYLDFYGHDSSLETGTVPTDSSFNSSVSLEMDTLIVLKVFHDTNNSSFGMVFTSRKAFLNLARTVQDQNGDLFACSDGTYKIHEGKWTLVNFGSYMTRYARGKFSKHFVPWAFMFVKSESEEAYREFFSTTRRFCNRFFGFDLEVRFGSLDHCAAIANAFQAEWPSIELLNCWPHVSRKVREQRSRLLDISYFDDVVYPHVVWMHNCRTYAQFRVLGKRCIEKWKQDGEVAYASWFEDVYFKSPWDTWFIGSAGNVSGVLPNQNAIEAFHRSLKQAIPNLRASTACVLNDSFPLLLLLVGEDFRSPDIALKPIRHYCEGPLPADLFVRARILLADKNNYLKMSLPDDTIIRAVLFNASHVVNSPTNPRKGVNVTATRAKRYSAGLLGNMDDRKPVTDAPLLYMSLHKVSVCVEGHQSLQNRPIWTSAEIDIIRNGYFCDCKTMRESGWICEHILATLSLLQKIDLDDVLRAIPVRNKPGRPRKSRSLLDEDTNDSHFFSTNNMLKLLTDSPGHVFHWSVMKEFVVNRNGTGSKEYIAGRITGWQENRGRYAWAVRFTDGNVILMECEELADLLSFSYDMGLNVDGLPE